jgi:hypothetical protein
MGSRSFEKGKLSDPGFVELAEAETMRSSASW